MTETLSRLLRLQACDQRIQQASQTLHTLQQSLAALKTEEQSRAQEVCEWQEKLRAAEKAREPLMTQLGLVKSQLRGKRYALHRGRAGYNDTVQREVALLESNKAGLEEELGALTDQITQDTEALRQAEAMATAQREEAPQVTSRIQDQIAAAEKELRTAQGERTALIVGIPAFLLLEYERIFAQRKGVAAVEVIHATCQGCHMRLPLQMCLELQKNPRLTFCPHCHRILFARREPNVPCTEPKPLPVASNGHAAHSPQRRPRTKVRTGKPRRVAGSPRLSPTHG
jgi:hypothetical protein